MMIIKKFLVLTLSFVSMATCCCQSCEIQLKYRICKTDLGHFYFPVQPENDITKYVEIGESNSDTLLIYINTKISERIDTLKNGTVTASGVRCKRYYYKKKRFYYCYTPARNLDTIYFIKLSVDN